MIGINVPIPVPVAYYSFGGFKDSIFGDSQGLRPAGLPASSPARRRSRRRWLDPSHGGINLGFPRAH